MNNTLNEYSLMTDMLSDQNMGAAWRHVKANKGAPGIDNMSIEEAEPFLFAHWEGIKEKLIDGSYYPLAVKRVIIPKPDGGERLLGIPAVIDRMIQQAISKFFDEVNHDMLMNRIGRKIKDKPLMQLIGRYLRGGIAEAETSLWFPSDKGVPQGGPLSPLLSNILLDELDKKLTRERVYFARYADDIIILVKSKHIGNKLKVSRLYFPTRTVTDPR